MTEDKENDEILNMFKRKILGQPTGEILVANRDDILWRSFLRVLNISQRYEERIQRLESLIEEIREVKNQ